LPFREKILKSAVFTKKEYFYANLRPELKLPTNTMSTQQIKVAIADDHKIFRDGIRMSLKDRDYLKILWEAEDGKDLMHKLQLKLPDVILMDIRMPEVDGINAISMIRKEYSSVKIIVLTMYDDQEMITKMMEMGANAYLTKTTDPEEIYQAILTCVNDDFYFNELVNKAVLLKLQHKKSVRQFYPNPVKLSEKELRILKLIADDKTTEEISKEVFLSPRTIETIRQNMKQKVGAKTIAGLVMYAMRNKFLQ
jgi:DNA-binding NarL/FixJ family response regulator